MLVLGQNLLEYKEDFIYMFLTERKAERRIEELKKYRYRDGISIDEFLSKEDTKGVTNPEVPNDFSEFTTIKLGETWAGRDRYLWLHQDVMIPQEWKGKQVLGLFDFGNTGAGNNSGFESLLYLNKKPYQGVDSNHKEVFLEESYCGTTVDFTFRLWSGLEGGGVPKDQEHRITQAQIAWLDEKVDDYYYLAYMVYKTILVLKEDDPIRHDLLKALNRSLHKIDWSCPGSEEFYHSIHEADDDLNMAIQKMEKHSSIHVTCIGHTHIDVAWLWRLKHTREKASRSFSTVMRLMEKYPEYIFLQTQPQIYEYVKEDFPELYEEMKQKAHDGQWETGGAMWVEADCNLTSGESLTRQILLGSKFFQEEFHQETEYLWLPDVFGYSWALPQILKKSGISMFMTTKISWNQYNRMPHDTFKWKGIDGSEILTHFITTPCPWNEPGSWFYTYNGELLPFTVKGVWDAYSEKDMNKDLLVSYGYGDGGGGVNRDMLEFRRRIDKIPGLPNCKTGTAKDYFRKLKETVETTDQYVHTWDGELYLEYHRGTYTSQGYNKLMNRKMEFLYRNAEWFTVMEAIAKGNLAFAKQEELTKGWKQILTHQFHDIIPGSSIREVYEDSRKNYPMIQEIGEKVEQSFYDTVVKDERNRYTVINSSSWTGNDVVKLSETRKGIFKNGAGEVLYSQTTTDGTYVEIKDVKATGFDTIVFEEREIEEQSPFVFDGKELETPYYQISFNEAGQMERLFDKTYNREVLKAGECANVLQMFEDKPLDNDAWDIDIFYQQKMKEITNLTTFQLVEQGPVSLTLHMEWKYGTSKIAQDMVVYANNRRIDFKTYVDFHEQHQLLKAAFPVDIRSTYATYDVQYGNVRRPNHWNTSWDQARFESVAHRYVDLSERNYGVSLLNDCKYGHDVKEHVMRITLLKSATHPDYAQDQGEHQFTYALLPHGGDFIEAKVVEEAYRLNDPMKVVSGHIELLFEQFIDFEGAHVELDAVKKSEDGQYVVVRFHEYAGETNVVIVRTGFDYTSYQEGDLRERPIEEAKSEKEIVMTVKPYEIKTILFSL